MDRKSPVSLWVVLVIAGTLLTAIYFLGVAEIPRPHLSPTVNYQPVTTPGVAALTSTASPLAVHYVNQYYGYSFDMPIGWQLATDYMAAWNKEVLGTNIDANNAEFLVLTTASPEDEHEFLSQSPHFTGNSDFRPGRAIFVEPAPVSVEDTEQLYAHMTNSGDNVEYSRLRDDTVRSVHKFRDGRVLEVRDIRCSSAHMLRRTGNEEQMKSLNIKMRIDDPQTDTTVLEALSNTVSCPK